MVSTGAGQPAVGEPAREAGLEPGFGTGPEGSSGAAGAGSRDAADPRPVEGAASRAALGARLALVVPAVIVFAVSLALDVRTLLPDVGFWDTAEFQAIGPVLGIAHPTGYPTYTLLAWAASVVLQPFGNPAYRADLLSALLVSGAGALTSILVVQLTRRPVLGLAAGLLLTLGPLAWGLALAADPHALHLFFAALLLVLLVTWMQRRQAGEPRAGRWLFAAAVTFGLSLGNHALTLLLAPGIAVFVLVVDPKILWQHARLVAACAAGLVLTTVAVYAYIPIRASMNPPLDYARPVTWDAFRYLVLGEQFRGTFHAMPSLGEGIRIVWTEVTANIGIAAWPALAGAVAGVLRSAAFAVLTVLWFALTFAFALGYENASIERYYMVPIMIAVIWAALAIDALWSVVVRVVDGLDRVGNPGSAPRSPVHSRPDAPAGGVAGGRDDAPAAGSLAGRVGPGRTRRYAGTALAGVVLLAPILAPVPDRLSEVDQSQNHDGAEWMHAVFQSLDPDAVIISWWSFSTTLWYGRFVDGLRPDVTIIDDRTILDDGYGDVQGAIDTYLGRRPVYLIRLPQDLPAIAAQYTLDRVRQIPETDGGVVYRVLPPGAAAKP